MLPPEILITVTIAAFIGLISGVFQRYLAVIIFCSISSILVEAQAAKTTYFYQFGDHLVAHILWSFAVGSATFIIVRVISRLRSAGNSAKTSPTNLKIIAAHTVGVFNVIFPIFPLLGSAMIGLLWFFSKTSSRETRVEIKEAFQFQTFYYAVIMFCDLVYKTSKTPENDPYIIALLAGFSILIWMALTITGIYKSIRIGSYRYPLTWRFLDTLGVKSITVNGKE